MSEVKTLWSYEDAIKRPYFHVKPLEKSQLNAWRNYLDYEIKRNSGARVKVLFERCLIACAFYEEFWMRVSGGKNVCRVIEATPRPQD